MEIYTVCSRCAAFSTHGCGVLNESEAERIVRKLLREYLLEQWDSIHLDVFTADEDVLYLAYPETSMKISLAGYALPFLEEYFTE